MRRSAAPSQNQNAKRQRILANNSALGSENSAAIKFCSDGLSSPDELCGEDKTEFGKENKSQSIKPKFIPQFKPKLNSFKTPVRQTSFPVQKIAGSKPESNDVTRYYNVMWGKMSKKKHKTWEGDGILVTKERTAILQDSEGKEIGKARGYKAGELATFTEGQTLCIGGKQVEISSEIPKEVYLSGRCFQQSSDAQSTPNNSFTKSVVIKPFSNPQKTSTTPGNAKSNALETSLSKRPAITPRYDPLSPGALVMPRPSATHQFEHNKRQLTLVDVVVDPYVGNILRPHQREGVTFLYECVMGLRGFVGSGAILADDMGLGKTLQCIVLVWTLFKQGMYGGQPITKRVLIITPGSLVKNWAVEFRKWLGNERMPVYTVNSDKKVQEFLHSPVFPVMVISYEMFVRYVEDIRKIKFDLVICDEAHRLKNAAIKTTMHISSLKIQRKVLLTGTPIQNDLTEFYSLADFCNPGILGSQTSFRRVYEEPILRGRQPNASAEEKEIGESRASELNRLTSQFLLRRTSEINNEYLPGKVEAVVFCRASSLQLTLYQHLTSSRWFKSCFSSSYAGSLHLMCIAALKKLCNHPSLLYRKTNDEEQTENQTLTDSETLYDDLQMYYPFNYDPDISEHSGKLKVLENLLSNIEAHLTGERVVVVSNYTQTLDVIQRLCERNEYRFLRLDGQTATSHRQGLVERFNRKGSQDFVFLLSSKAGGVGLNLTGGSILILYDIDWNPANDIQAMARVWRDGQRKKVKIYRLLTTGTIEEKIYQRQISKQGLSGAVADTNVSSKPQDFSREDLKDLFTLYTKTTCLTHDLLNCSSCTKTEAEEENSRCRIIGGVNLTRTCQLGSLRQETKEKNLSMAELLQWKHFSRPIENTTLEDGMLRMCADDIDFVFQTETN